jgi:hypothetical protein
MSASPHPQDLRQMCGRAAELFESLLPQDLAARGETLRELNTLLGRIDERVKELDLVDPDFPREQGWLVDAASALQSIQMDRGGWHVEKYVRRAAEDLRHVADG